MAIVTSQKLVLKSFVKSWFSNIIDFGSGRIPHPVAIVACLVVDQNTLKRHKGKLATSLRLPNVVDNFAA